MSKKAAGPKESQLRQLREGGGSEVGNGRVNPQQLLSDLEQIGHRATSAIDALMESKKEKRVEADAAKAKIDEQFIADVEPIEKQIDQLNELYHRTTGRYYLSSLKPGKAKGDGETRQRKSADQLADDAKAIHAFVKAKGKDGAKGSEIVEKFGKFSLPPIAFVEKYGGGLKLGKTGDKAATVYYAE